MNDIYKTYKYWRAYHDNLTKINALNEDVCSLSVGRLISREKLPQIMQKDVDEFINFLKNKGINVDQVQFPVNELIPTQSKLNVDKIKMLIKKSIEDLKTTPIFITTNNEILDGHHRYYALKTLDKNTLIPTLKIELSFNDAVKQMKSFPKTFSKDIEA